MIECFLRLRSATPNTLYVFNTFTLQTRKTVNGCEQEGERVEITITEFIKTYTEKLPTINIAAREGVMEPLLYGTELRREQNIATDPTDGGHAVVLLSVRLRIESDAQAEG